MENDKSSQLMDMVYIIEAGDKICGFEYYVSKRKGREELIKGVRESIKARLMSKCSKVRDRNYE